MKAFEIGQQASVTRRFTIAELDRFYALAGMSRSAASNAIPGPLLGGMISDLLGTELPGRGTNWLKQKYAFVRTAAVGEPITATVTIIRLRPDKDLVNLRTTCTTAQGDLICEGEALVLVRDVH